MKADSIIFHEIIICFSTFQRSNSAPSILLFPYSVTNQIYEIIGIIIIMMQQEVA